MPQATASQGNRTACRESQPGPHLCPAEVQWPPQLMHPVIRQTTRWLQAGHRPRWRAVCAGHPVAMQPAALQATHQVIDTQLLELQHHAAQVGPQDFRVGLLLQVFLEAGLCVQAETLAGLRTPGTSCPLMSASLQQRGRGLRADCWGETRYSVAV